MENGLIDKPFVILVLFLTLGGWVQLGFDFQILRQQFDLPYSVIFCFIS